MSRATLIVPAALSTSILPPALRPTSTRLATTWPADTLRFEVPGLPVRSGESVTYVAWVGAIAVTLTTTAVAPAGTAGLPKPSMVTTRGVRAPIGPLPAPVSHWLATIPGAAGRVSHTRIGVIAV